MANASRDQNNVPTLIAALNTDGTTVVKVVADSSNSSLGVSDGTTGTDHGRAVAYRDENSVPVLLALSSADGVTPVEVYADSNGKLLIKST